MLSALRGFVAMRKGDIQTAIKYVDLASQSIPFVSIQFPGILPGISQLAMMNLRLGREENLKTVIICLISLFCFKTDQFVVACGICQSNQELSTFCESNS